MKPKTSLFILLLFCVTVSLAQKKDKLKQPPGTVQINDTLFADRTEIANVHFREYLHWLLKYDSLKYESMLPDTTVWSDTLLLNENPAIQFYFRHPGFNNYPVVGVSYEQVIDFCIWRSDRVNELIEKIPVNKRLFTKVYYRLPTKQEWEMLASCGLDSNSKYFKKLTKRTKEWMFYNTTEEIKNQITKRDSNYYRPILYTTPTQSYLPNKYGLYQTIGNLSEMVAEKGIAKGGSFLHRLEESKISNNQYYTKPERWLGFRCVAVVIK